MLAKRIHFRIQMLDKMLKHPPCLIYYSARIVAAVHECGKGNWLTVFTSIIDPGLTYQSPVQLLPVLHG
jgi:hypothetical protein